MSAVSKKFLLVVFISNLFACSMKTIELEHSENTDLTKICRTAFFDWHAASHMVDYYNYKCALKAIEKGYILKNDTFDSKDFSIPHAPNDAKWTEALALEELKSGRLSEEKYGYILGMLEMTYRAKISKAKLELESGQISEAEFNTLKRDAELSFYGVPTT